MFLVLYGAWFISTAERLVSIRRFTRLTARRRVGHVPTADRGPIWRGEDRYEKRLRPLSRQRWRGKANQAPPFIGSDWVLGNPDRLIRIPLAGLTGPITSRPAMELAMPAMGAALSDADSRRCSLTSGKAGATRAPPLSQNR